MKRAPDSIKGAKNCPNILKMPTLPLYLYTLKKHLGPFWTAIISCNVSKNKQFYTKILKFILSYAYVIINIIYLLVLF